MSKHGVVEPERAERETSGRDRSTPSTPPRRGKGPRKSSSRPRRAGGRTPARAGEHEHRGGLTARFHRLYEWLEAGGVEGRGLSSFFYLWQKLGWKGLIPLAFVIGFPLGEFTLLGYITNSTVPRLAGDFGVTFQADDWEYHPFTLKTVARGVKIRPRHEVDGRPVFTAGAIEFQGDIGSTFTGVKELVWDVVRFRWPTFHTFNTIAIRNGQLHLDRSATGHLNWNDYAESVPEARKREVLSGLYRINAISIDDLTINYVERLSGNSGGGIIQTAQANVHVDGVTGTITDIKQALDAGELPTKIQLSGRSADGTIDLNGRMALVAGSPGPAGHQRYVNASTGSRPSSSGPFYELTIAIDNIGAAAFVRTMPPTRIMATSGTLAGRVVLRHHEPPCTAAAAMRDVRFAPNPQLVPVRAEFDRLQRLLKDRVVTRAYEACEPLLPDVTPGKADPPPAPGPTRKARLNSAASAASFVAAFNEQANRDAPPEVRAVVALDSQNLTGKVAKAVMNDVTNEINNQVGRAIAKTVGGETGRVLQESLTGTSSAATSTSGRTKPPAAQQNDSAVAKGVKSLGSGIKRLFGGGKDKKDPKKSGG